MHSNKHSKLASIILAILLMLSVLPTAVFAVTEDTARLTILHVNDRHGRMQAEPYISQMVKDLKSNSENVLLLDAGDSLHGQTVTNLSKGEAMVEIMNEVGYDAMVTGNHDFNFGVERLTELSKMMNFPLLAANVKGENGENLFEACKVFKMNGITVGVFGIATPETITASDPRIVAGLKFEDPAQTAAAEVEELKGAGCDIIIALTHLGEDSLSAPGNRSDALAAVPGIDVIIDGHSHTALESGRIEGGTMIAQTGEYGGKIGVIEITKSGGNISKTAKLVALPEEDEKTELIPDERIAARIAEEEAEIEPITGAVVGNTPVLLQGEKAVVRTEETNLANLITDSMKYVTGADMAVLTGGNIRASIEPGDITMGEALTTLPFSNLITTVELGGGDILEMLEHGVSGYPEPVGEHIQVSGIKFEFNPDAEPMSRVINVTMADGSAFDESKTYTVATIDFLAAGGDGYAMMANGKNKTYYQGDVEAFVEYLSTNPSMKDEPDGRITITSAQKQEQQLEQSSQPEQTSPAEQTPQAPENPKSESNSNAYLYVVILAGAVALIIIIILRRKK